MPHFISKYSVKIFVILLLISFLIPLEISFADLKIIPGGKCAKFGDTQNYQGKKFLCIKSGSKLVWDKGTILNNQSSTNQNNTSQNFQETSSQDFATPADCKLKKPAQLLMDDGPNGSLGFPRNSNQIVSLGNRSALLLFVDFSDAIADSTLKSNFQESQIPRAQQFFKEASLGNYNLKIVASEKIYRLNNPATFYNLYEAPGGGPLAGKPVLLESLLLDAMAAADNDIDFSQYDFVTVAAPLSKNLTLSGAFGVMPSNTQKYDGAKFAFASFSPLDSILPKSQYNKNWNWIHDIGHMLGLMHPYKRGDRNSWDIMYPFAAQPDFLGWNKWKLNWISDEQVYCISNFVRDTYIFSLSPVGENSSKKKIAIIKLDKDSALVIESRAHTSFDLPSLQSNDLGTIVYKVDVTKNGDTRDGNSGAITLLNDDKRKVFDKVDYGLGTIKQGETINNSGFLIKVLQSTSSGDMISVVKVK